MSYAIDGSFKVPENLSPFSKRLPIPSALNLGFFAKIFGFIGLFFIFCQNFKIFGFSPVSL